MQISSVAPKSLGASLGEVDRGFAQSTSIQPKANQQPKVAENSLAEAKGNTNKIGQGGLAQDKIKQDKLDLTKVNDSKSPEKLRTDELKAKEKDETKEPTPQELNDALKQVNDSFMQKNQNLEAKIERDKETGIDVFIVTDKTTNEVVRQFPSKAVIAMAAVIGQSLDAKGQLISEKA